MAFDPTLPVRQAVVESLRSDAVVLAVVEAGRIYGPSPPPKPHWPHIRVDNPASTGLQVTCGDGADVVVSVHCFVEDEDGCPALAAIIARSLADQTLVLDADHKFELTWLDGQSFPDGSERDKWHGLIRFSGRVLTG